MNHAPATPSLASNRVGGNAVHPQPSQPHPSFFSGLRVDPLAPKRVMGSALASVSRPPRPPRLDGPLYGTFASPVSALRSPVSR